MTAQIQDILGPVFNPGIFEPNRLIPNLPFEDYQRLPGVNASLLKQMTPYEMLSYAVGVAALDETERALVELTGSNCADVLERVELATPHTVPVRWVTAARNLIESDKLSDAQKAAWAKVIEGCDSREINGSTLASMDNKGLLRFETREVTESRLTDDQKASRAMNLAVGKATHTAILEPHMFDADTWHQHYQLCPSKTLTSKAALEAQASDPRMLITSEIVDTARRCRDAVWKHRLAAELLRDGQNEITGKAWNDEPMCWQKIRIDHLPNDSAKGIVDIKTTRASLSDSALRSEIYKFGYHLQAAFYLDTLAMIEMDAQARSVRRDQFHIIFVTKTAPFMARCKEINLSPPDENLVERGRALYTERLAQYAHSWHVEKEWWAYEHEGITTLRA